MFWPILIKIIVINIARLEEDVTVPKYKRELGKPYNRFDLLVSDLASDKDHFLSDRVSISAHRLGEKI